jgi:K+-transporting ATPase ATPase A chain
MWFLPISIIVFTLIVAIPLSKYIAWIMEGKYRPWAFFRWFESRPSTCWK